MWRRRRHQASQQACTAPTHHITIQDTSLQWHSTLGLVPHLMGITAGLPGPGPGGGVHADYYYFLPLEKGVSMLTTTFGSPFPPRPAPLLPVSRTCAPPSEFMHYIRSTLVPPLLESLPTMPSLSGRGVPARVGPCMLRSHRRTIFAARPPVSAGQPFGRAHAGQGTAAVTKGRAAVTKGRAAVAKGRAAVAKGRAGLAFCPT
eukprot:gene23227-biopygen4297